MNIVGNKFSQKFGSHWVAVKFYKEEPVVKGAKRLENVSFCEAIKKATLNPIILDKKSIVCEGAQQAFGWNSKYRYEFLKKCEDKSKASKKVLKSMFSQVVRLNNFFKYIGLNTDSKPDLVISYLPPEGVMKVIKKYNYHQGDGLDISLVSMMSVCSGVAVKTYLDGSINVSFGCDDSRKYAEIGRDRLAVGIPRQLFNVFLD